MKGNFFLRFPSGKAKALTFSYDDGVYNDIRLAEIFKKYNMKATFNINSGLFGDGTGTNFRSRLSETQVKELYCDPSFEVACHGFTHPFLDRCDPALALNQVVLDRLKLEEVFGREVHGMAYPVGTYNDEVIEILKSAGIYYSRTVESHMKFILPKDWLKWHPTCHHNNPKLNQLADEFLATEVVRHDPLLFYVWGHSYEFGDNDNWEIIERFAENTANRSDIWYATNMEIFRYCRSFSRLQYSADGTLVYNPTSTDLWVSDLGGKVYNIKPGQTVDCNKNRGV